MPNYNSCTFIGHLTRDVEQRFTTGGTAVASCGIAVSEKQKDKPDKVLFLDWTAFGRTAEVATEYLAKGAPVLLSGRLELQQWEKDGQKRSKHCLIVDRLVLLGQRQERRDEYSEAAAPQEQSDGEVPF